MSISADDCFDLPETPIMSSLSPTPVTDDFSSERCDNVGVGLSNPQLSQGRRMMLDLVNRLHSTGSLSSFILPLSLVAHLFYIGSKST
jgi:hypothetical protein